MLPYQKMCKLKIKERKNEKEKGKESDHEFIKMG